MEVELVCVTKDDSANYGEDNRNDEVDQLILRLARSTALRYPQCHLVRHGTTNCENGNGRHYLSQVAQTSELKRYSANEISLLQ